jgi:hypothetical protein
MIQRSALLVGLALAGLPAAAAAADEPSCTITQISEIRLGVPLEDGNRYLELRGEPLSSLEAVAYVVIGRGVDGGSGVVRAVIDLTGAAIPDDGLMLIADSPLVLGRPADLVEPSLEIHDVANTTHMLVVQFAGAVGQDLDADDDGVLDYEQDRDVKVPWLGVTSSVAIVGRAKEGGVAFTHHYSETVVGPDVGGALPMHVYRCTPSVDQWLIGPEDPDADDDGAPDGLDSPGERNALCPCAADTDGDRFIDIDDLVAVILAWGSDQSAVDVDDDGVVGMSDLVGVLSSWGPCDD